MGSRTGQYSIRMNRMRFVDGEDAKAPDNLRVGRY